MRIDRRWAVGRPAFAYGAAFAASGVFLLVTRRNAPSVLRGVLLIGVSLVALAITRMMPADPYGIEVVQPLDDGGVFTSVRGFEGVPGRGITFKPTWVREYDGEFEKLDELRLLVEAGKLTPRVARVFRPEEAGEAHRLLEAGGTRGAQSPDRGHDSDRGF